MFLTCPDKGYSTRIENAWPLDTKQKNHTCTHNGFFISQAELATTLSNGSKGNPCTDVQASQGPLLHALLTTETAVLTTESVSYVTGFNHFMHEDNAFFQYLKIVGCSLKCPK